MTAARDPDPEFQAWVERAKAGSMETAIQLCGFRPAKGFEHAKDRAGPCPACGGRDRFSVKVASRVFNCRGCGAKGQNALSLALVGEHLSFLDACRELTGEDPPKRDMQETAEQKAARNARRVAREEQARADEAARAAEEAKDIAERVALARYGWNAGVSIPCTAVEDYLVGARKLDLTGINRAVLRFADRVCLRSPAGVALHYGPAMLAAGVDAEGRFSALHRTWVGGNLDHGSKNGRPLVMDPATGEFIKTKKTLGAKQGAAIRLVSGWHFDDEGNRTPPFRLFMGEGIETTLSVYTALRAAGSEGLLEGSAFWCGIDLYNLAHITPPAWCADLVLIGDGDSDPVETRKALGKARDRFAAAGVQVRILMAPAGADFNDMIMGGA